MDWIATALTLAGLWRVGNKKEDGFILGVAGNLMWAGWGLVTQNFSIVFINAVLLALNLRALYKWSS
jgi:hypothetical protein